MPTFPGDQEKLAAQLREAGLIREEAPDRPAAGVYSQHETEFQAEFVALARRCGWDRIAHFRKVRVQRKSGAVYWETPVAEDGKGFLDLELVRERLIKVELKVKPNKPTPEQLEWLAAYKKAGVEAHVFYPEDWPTFREVLR